MTTKLRKGCLIAACAMGYCGCATLSGDPLSPPHVRKASCATQNVATAMEQKLSPEYQDWLSEVKHFCRDTQREFEDEYHKNERWPEPYSSLAQHAVRQLLDLQAENARQQLTTLWDLHFESATGKLNPMGRKRLQDIVGQAGTLGRTVFVQRSPSADETAIRLAEVRKELDLMDPENVAFDVAEARTIPTFVLGEEAKRTMKLLTEPPKKDSSGGYQSGSTGSNGGSQ